MYRSILNMENIENNRMELPTKINTHNNKYINSAGTLNKYRINTKKDDCKIIL